MLMKNEKMRVKWRILMKKGIIVLVSALLVILISVGSLSASFVKPAGLAKFSQGFFLFQDKCKVDLWFRSQDHVGAFEYKISAALLGSDGCVIGSPTWKTSTGIKYPTDSDNDKHYDVTDKEFDASTARGTFYIFTTADGAYSSIFYDLDSTSEHKKSLLSQET